MLKKFQALGVNEVRMKVIGNLKLDVTTMQKDSIKLNLPENKRYITLGSTQKDEEHLILKSLSSLNPEITFIIAPRRPDRFIEVAHLLDKLNIIWRFIDDDEKKCERVILVNKLGILEACYAKSHLAIVGGSFIKNKGGHNVYEPVKNGSQVIYGPYTYNQRSLTSIVENFDVGTPVTIENLKTTVERVLKLGRIPRAEVDMIRKSSEGATKKTINIINSLF